MITTKGTNNKIVIEFEKEDTDELKRFVYSKIEEISSILNLIPKFTNCEGGENE